ncbi:MAG TPA: hypothetical protein VE549_05385, partial [Myxococcaceae bacterium]|nr:hypothetical protein [Myxococcaceae bacterium]
RLVVGMLLLLGSAAIAVDARSFPRNPTRSDPPPRISETARTVGSRAPHLSLPSSTGEKWSLSDALQKGPAVLVFYRGHW